MPITAIPRAHYLQEHRHHRLTHQESPSRGAAGDVRAWDAVTGSWSGPSIPFPSQARIPRDLEDDGWKQRSGVNVWNMLTVDAERGIAYLPFGAPTFDRYGGDHKGTNLFSDSWWRWMPIPENISGISRPPITTSGL